MSDNKGNGHFRRPIVVSEEMVDTAIRLQQTVDVYLDCLRGKCLAPDPQRERCEKCRSFKEAASRMRILTHARHWDLYGFGCDQKTPPDCIKQNPQACADWRWHWQLRCEIIEQARLKSEA